MTYEPLKGKKVMLGYKFKRNKTTDEPEFGFFEDDINSAIEGLKYDIKHEKEYIMFPRSGRKALELVKKWFPDAIDNDTKERVE